MKNRPVMMILMLMTVLVLSFQNCSKSSQEVLFSELSSTSKPADDTDDNGHPYDGKIFVLTGVNCPDGTNVQSKIIMKDPTDARLVREQCQDISPVALGMTDFQLDPQDENKLYYKSETFGIIGTPLDMSKVTPEVGFSYWMSFDFGTDPDTDVQPYISKLRLYENGRLLGPGHAVHRDIRNLGQGRFSHWFGYLYFSASDNSNPLTNGRVYTWDIE